MNRNYENFRNNIVYAMRNSGLDIGAMYYILKDVLNDVERTYSSSIQQEIEAERLAQEEAARQEAEQHETIEDQEVEDVDL